MEKKMDSLSEFQHHLQDIDLSSLTTRGYLGDARQFITWFTQTNGETFSLESVTPTDIRAYRQFLQVTKQRKASTVNRKLAALSALMAWAKIAEKISSNPTDGVKLVKQTQSAPKWLDKKEQFSLQRAIEKDLQLSKLRYPKRWVTRRRDASLVQFLFNTGLRLGETIALRLNDVELSERKGSVLVRMGKGNKQRSVPLNAEARQAIQAWLVVRPQTQCDFVWVAVEDVSVGLSGRAVQRVLYRYGQDAGLNELTPHVARHTFAKNLVDSGVGLEKIASLLGHSSLNTTRIYTTPDEHDLEMAVAKLEK
jgi:site-specific recombinase XerD